MDRDFLTSDEYLRKALGFEKTRHLSTLPIDFHDARLIEGLMGLCGETGEAMDILKKAMFQGHTIDIQELALELGDVLWYLALSIDALGYTFNDIQQMNLEKLGKRYPDGFSEERSINRDEE